MSDKSQKHGGWQLVIIIFIVIGMLAGISFLPLERWSDGKIKNINIFGDILSDTVVEDDSTVVDDAAENIDVELLQAMKSADTRKVDTTDLAYDNTPLIEIQPSVENGLVVIEDYTASGQGLEALRSSVHSGTISRIAVVGDSYIEGDIFTQNLRELLQTEYGGGGVGYMNLYSEFPGFRRSVRQSGDGWKEYSANKKCNSANLGLAQHYFTPSGGKAVAKYEGVSALQHVDSWSKSQFLFISPSDVKVKARANGDWVEYDICGSPDVQSIVIDGNTDCFEITASAASLVGLGVWLTDSTGVSVDCMSSRGFSGLTLTKVSENLCSQMRKYVDYDLIILEFGINAMSPDQKNFSVYSSKMVDVVNHVRACYPDADILLMGIGDRGEKRNGAVHSISSAAYMISAQRDAARKAKCLFWDTRAAMGGDDAIVEWTRGGYANKDYIHLSHKGGARLARLLYDAIQHNLNR